MRHHMISALLLAFIFAGSAVAGPQLTIDEEEFHFGYMPQNSNVSHIYWLKSTGDEPLKIQKVLPGCGCTKAPLEKYELPVGDSTRLEIIFSSKRYNGPVKKEPVIQSNDLVSRRKISFITHVAVFPDSLEPVVVKPYKLDISQFGPNVRDRIEFELVNKSDQPLEVALIDTHPEVFDLTLPEAIPANGSASGALTVHEDKLAKEFTKSFTFELNDPEKSRYTIPVRRTVRDFQPTTAKASQ